MHDLAVEQIRHRGQPDMRVRTDVDAVAGAELGRPEVVKEDERSDQARLRRGECPADAEVTEIDRAGNDHLFDRLALGRIAWGGVLAGKETHDGLLGEVLAATLTVL